MKILSHRGYWKLAGEKNTTTAFMRSFALGYGTETDVRDCKGELVISHDMPGGSEISFAALLAMAADGNPLVASTPLSLALNIKADGLAGAMRKELDAYPLLDPFVFDMSVPDMPSYFDAGIPVFTRLSEVERQPVWLEASAGVWLDSFGPCWYDNRLIEDLLVAGKRVCIVSPELHKRAHLAFWEQIKPLVSNKNLILCTDFPEDAAQYFFKTESER